MRESTSNIWQFYIHRMCDTPIHLSFILFSMNATADEAVFDLIYSCVDVCVCVCVCVYVHVCDCFYQMYIWKRIDILCVLFFPLNNLFFCMFLLANATHQIMSLAAIPQTALHMSRVQFYSCLKLIAAHQSSVPLRKELIASSVTLPLPKFSWKESPVESVSTAAESNGVNVTGDDRQKWRNTNASRSPDLIELARVDMKGDVVNSDITSTDSEVEQKESERKNAVSNSINWLCLLSHLTLTQMH